MSEAVAVLQARTPPPRQLGTKETLDTLIHWKTTFRTFYKRDDAYKHFMRENITWDPLALDGNYGQAADIPYISNSKTLYFSFIIRVTSTLAYL